MPPFDPFQSNQILHIETLTSHGRQQLDTDLAYLGNVVNAIGLTPHPLLAHIGHLLSPGVDAALVLSTLQTVSVNSVAERAVRDIDMVILGAFD